MKLYRLRGEPELYIDFGCSASEAAVNFTLVLDRLNKTKSHPFACGGIGPHVKQQSTEWNPGSLALPQPCSQWLVGWLVHWSPAAPSHRQRGPGDVVQPALLRLRGAVRGARRARRVRLQLQLPGADPPANRVWLRRPNLRL